VTVPGGQEEDVEAEERFWTHVDRRGPDECWEWTSKKWRGYGYWTLRGKNWRVHRYSYTIMVGPIPEGMTIDHLCRNRGCVNPAHLEVVTHRENTLRGTGPSAQNARKTHCKRGHEFTPENTLLKGGGRKCAVCIRAGERARRAREREELAAARALKGGREGIVTVYDHEGVYLGCMGREAWDSALAAADATQEPNAEGGRQ
jgi:hypothetical protein